MIEERLHALGQSEPSTPSPIPGARPSDWSTDPRRGALALFRAGGLTALLVLAPQAPAIQSVGAESAAATVASEPFSIVDSVLTGTRSGHVETASGDYEMAADCKLYLRHGGAIRSIEDLSPYIGEAVQLELIKGRAVWIAIESREILQ